MLKEYDVTIAKETSGDIPKGSRGAILIVYDEENYEVEFVDSNDNTIGIVTVSETMLEKRPSNVSN